MEEKNINENQHSLSASQAEEQAVSKVGAPWGTIAAVIAVVLLAGGAVWFIKEIRNAALAPDQDEVVAVVDGEEITRQLLNKRIEQIAAAYMMEVADLDQLEVLNLMINEILMLEDARKQGIEATDEDVQALLDSIKAQFATEEEFEGELAAYNITLEDLRKDIVRQAIFEAYEAHIAAERIEIKDEEVQELYRDIAAEEDMPPLEDIYAEVEQQLRQEKMMLEFDRIIQELLEKANVEILL